MKAQDHDVFSNETIRNYAAAVKCFHSGIFIVSMSCVNQ